MTWLVREFTLVTPDQRTGFVQQVNDFQLNYDTARSFETETATMPMSLSPFRR